MLHDPGLLQPEPPSPWQAIADPNLLRRHSNTQRQVWLVLGSLGPDAHEILFAPSERLWQVWGLILNLILPLLLQP